jgi:hypothetical protein
MLMRLDQEPSPTPQTTVIPIEEIAISFPRPARDRLPLAEATLWLWSYRFDRDFRDGVFERHSGRSFEDVLTFPKLLDLVADALLQHGGKARPAVRRAERDGTRPIKPRESYCKFGRLPEELSLGLFEEATARLDGLLPPASAPLSRRPAWRD